MHDMNRWEAIKKERPCKTGGETRLTTQSTTRMSPGGQVKENLPGMLNPRLL